MFITLLFFILIALEHVVYISLNKVSLFKLQQQIILLLISEAAVYITDCAYNILFICTRRKGLNITIKNIYKRTPLSRDCLAVM